ncbi:hypothetical protein ADIS_2720 [Lunatimonas lonarensis]|uniref:DUF3299 domain-containing protein n=1 Tax=Lunatimonas lonarensis TaxID=1232681 RepID=R7ZS71_9BACT|nr:hypothetical protein [Lunatimonas lonarensis]EON76849.1 hypothetical protein ADIS_2720 [Lunatimonas lonarensis]
MRLKFILFCIISVSCSSLSAQSSNESNLWAVFGKTRFVEKLNREYALYYLYPVFNDEIRQWEGREVELTGFYIPLDLSPSSVLILSKFPMAECFFCGQSGPESIAVVYLKERYTRKLKTDQVVTVRGVLQLNDSDVNELNFILKQARIVKLD